MANSKIVFQRTSTRLRGITLSYCVRIRAVLAFFDLLIVYTEAGTTTEMHYFILLKPAK
jgi:hypothetical protein